MTISPELTWDTHINTILARANRMLAFLRCNSVMSFTTDHRKLLYLTFVRLYIGYASEVWAPSTIRTITKIESSKQGNEIHLKHALARGYFLSWAPFSPQSATVNKLKWSERLNFSFQVSRWPLHLTHRWLKLFQFTYFKRIAKLWNAREPDLNPLVLLLLLISLNLTYSNAILLLFVQTMTSLTLTPGSRSAANAVAHVIFY